MTFKFKVGTFVVCEGYLMTEVGVITRLADINDEPYYHVQLSNNLRVHIMELMLHEIEPTLWIKRKLLTKARQYRYEN